MGQVSLSIPEFACLLLLILVYSFGAYSDFSGRQEAGQWS